MINLEKMISILNWLFYTFLYNFLQYYYVRSGFAVLKALDYDFFKILVLEKKTANRSTVSNILSVLIGTYFEY